MLHYILKENVLTDDILTIADKGKVFKGGYIAFIKRNTFLNAWQDIEETIKFRSVERLKTYLDKHYSNEFDFDFNI